MSARVLEADRPVRESRDPGLVQAIVAATAAHDVDVVDRSADPDHDRAVITVLGVPRRWSARFSVGWGRLCLLPCAHAGAQQKRTPVGMVGIATAGRDGGRPNEPVRASMNLDGPGGVSPRAVSGRSARRAAGYPARRPDPVDTTRA